tara:strand:- start:753 stop:1919 length:1167 start_codon:yes stop_codon:yes gene_type:complete
VPKTAGTNIRKWLLSQTEDKQDFWWWDKSGTDRAHLHEENIDKYIDIAKVQNDLYFIFGFVRNPYHRIFSAYNEVKWKGPCKNHSFESVLKDFLTNDKINELPVHFLQQVKFLKYATNVYKYELLHESIGDVSEKLGLAALDLKYRDKTHKYTYFENYSQSMIDIINKVYAEDFETYNYYKIPEIVYRFRFPEVVDEDFAYKYKEINVNIENIEGFKCRSIFQEIKLCTVAYRRQHSTRHGKRLYEIINKEWDNIRYYINSKWIISICESFIDLDTDTTLSLLCAGLVSSFMVEKSTLSNLQRSPDFKQQRCKEDSPLYGGFWHYNCNSGDMLQNKLRRLVKMMKKHPLALDFFKILYINSIIHEQGGLHTTFKHARESGKALNIMFT